MDWNLARYMYPGKKYGQCVQVLKHWYHEYDLMRSGICSWSTVKSESLCNCVSVRKLMHFLFCAI